jgi:hypothetical protein
MRRRVERAKKRGRGRRGQEGDILEGGVSRWVCLKKMRVNRV